MEAGGIPLATLEGQDELAKRVAGGEAPANALEKYAKDGKVFQLLDLSGDGTKGSEVPVRYDPDLARCFRWVVLQDIPAARDETTEVAHRREFHEFIRSSWRLAARFEPGRSRVPGVIVCVQPSDFEPDEARMESLRSRLNEAELSSVRDTSRAFSEWLVRGGAIFRSVGAFPEAKAFLLPAVARDSTWAEAQFQLGLVYLLEEDDAKAKECFLLGMFHDPSHGGIHYNLGTVLEKGGDMQGAETEYRAATLLLEDPTPAHARLGALLAQVGDLEGAAEELQRLRQIDPGGEAERFLAEFLGAP
jgi:tetratricopeptide (TPR) repeat protein